MKKLSIRAIALVLCLAMVAGYIVLPDAPAAKAETATTTTNPNLVENGTLETTLADFSRLDAARLAHDIFHTGTRPRRYSLVAESCIFA